MSIALHSEPWSAYCETECLSQRENDGDVLQTSSTLRLVGVVEKRLLWNGSEPVIASIGGQNYPTHWDIPVSPLAGHHPEGRCRLNSGEFRFKIDGLPERVEANLRTEVPRESWLLWQYQRYNELALSIGNDPEHLESFFKSGSRRSWKTVSDLWQRGGENEAEISLIVELAQGDRLVAAMRSVQRSPRRMLLRIHQQERIARIQEMDATTLRAYARAPGRTAAQKAGPHQKLLAVVRKDTYDLPENRLAVWAAQRMEKLANSYCHRNERFRSSGRYQSVRDLQVLSEALPRSPLWEEISPLSVHLDHPTYCLQFDPRFRELWKAYLKIRRQERALDDAWKWQFHLWGTSARLILAVLMRNLPGWSERRESTPYFRKEGIQGEWSQGPSTPGPFLSRDGLCHVIEMRLPRAEQQIANLGVPDRVFSTGADWVIAWPEQKRLCLFWAAVASDAKRKSALPSSLSAQLDKDSRDSGWDWTALVLLAVPDEDPEATEWIDTVSRATLLRIPENVHLHWPDLQAGLDLSMENLRAR